ncbi:hypothetical protein JHK85_040901 [Glycine max]|nr:hypothetical protein JHK86_040317 [Glycine max]KAG4965926.1 hypothetical protein JHK85_040901 [Glycine max]
MGAGREVSISLDGVRDKNLMQLKKLNLALFPVMDKHLNILAKQHIETRFVKLNAEKSPFLAEKLKIIVLPTLVVCL